MNGNENSALHFDGVDDYINAGNILSDLFTAENAQFSFSVWINYADVSANIKIFGKYDHVNEKRQFVAAMKNGRIKFGYCPSLAWNPYCLSTTKDSISTGEWTLLSVTYDGSIETQTGIERLQIFVNGQPWDIQNDKASKPSIGIFDNALDEANINLGIGNVVFENGEPYDEYIPFSGEMDDFKIFDGVLTENEAREEYLGKFAPLEIKKTITDASSPDKNGAIDIAVSGGKSPYRFLWSNGSDQEDISDLAPGEYSVTVTDANEQKISASYTVKFPYIPMQLSADITNESKTGSNDGAIDLSVQGGLQPFSFAWSNSRQAEDIADLAPGEYSVTVTDATQKEISKTFSVLEATHSISGEVIAGKKIIAYAPIIAYSASKDTLFTAIDTVYSKSNGRFNFDALKPGTYILYSPYHAVNAEYANTYYYASDKISSAERLALTEGDIIDIVFEILPFSTSTREKNRTCATLFHPNPASTLLNIAVQADWIVIINNSGTVVMSTNERLIDITILPKGCYTVIATVKGTIVQEQLVVQ